MVGRMHPCDGDEHEFLHSQTWCASDCGASPWRGNSIDRRKVLVGGIDEVVGRRPGSASRSALTQLHNATTGGYAGAVVSWTPITLPEDSRPFRSPRRIPPVAHASPHASWFPGHPSWVSWTPIALPAGFLDTPGFPGVVSWTPITLPEDSRPFRSPRRIPPVAHASPHASWFPGHPSWVSWTPIALPAGFLDTPGFPGGFPGHPSRCRLSWARSVLPEDWFPGHPPRAWFPGWFPGHPPRCRRARVPSRLACGVSPTSYTPPHTDRGRYCLQGAASLALAPVVHAAPHASRRTPAPSIACVPRAARPTFLLDFGLRAG